MFWMTTLVLAAHLLCMNVASGAPMIAACLEWREASSRLGSRYACDLLSRLSVFALLLGIALGVILVGLRWSESYSSVWIDRLGRKAAWGIGEIAFSLVLGVVIWVLRTRATRTDPKKGRALRSFLGVLSGLNLLYHFPPLFSIGAISQDWLSQFPGANQITAAEFRQLMSNPEVLARMLHVVLACFAVTGAAIVTFSLRQEPAVKQQATRLGAWIVLVPSLLQIPAGLWLTVSLSPSRQQVLLSEPIPLLLLAGSVFASLMMMNDFVSIAFGDDTKGRTGRGLVTLVAIVIAMTAVLKCLNEPTARPQNRSPLITMTSSARPLAPDS